MIVRPCNLKDIFLVRSEMKDHSLVVVSESSIYVQLPNLRDKEWRHKAPSCPRSSKEEKGRKEMVLSSCILVFFIFFSSDSNKSI